MSAEIVAEHARDEISSLIETLHRTEQRLAYLTAGEVDSVASSTGRTYLLQRSQEQLRVDEAVKQAAILNALPANIALLDHEGNVVGFNERWRDFGGRNGCLPADGHEGQNYLAICDRAAAGGSPDGARAAAGIRLVLDGRHETFSMEYECHSPSAMQWYRMTATPIDKGSRKGVVIMHTDVTDRTLAQQATQQTTALLEAVLDGAPDAIYVKDTEGRYLLCNKAGADFMGRSVAEIIGLDDSTVFGQQDAKAVGAGDRRVMATGVAHSTEQILVGVAGPRFFHIAKAPYRGPSGEMLGTIGISRDITEQHALVVDLAAEHARLVAVQNIAKIGSWSLDIASGVYEWAEQTHRICETDPKRFVPTIESVGALIHRDDRSAMRAALKHSIEVVEPTYSIEHRVVLASGVERIVEHHWNVTRDRAGTALVAFGTCQDITARRHGERTLRESQSLLSMSGRLAHVGAWAVELPATHVQWSDTVALMHDVPVGTKPTIEEAFSYYSPEMVESIRSAFLRCQNHGEPFDIEFEITGARGRQVLARVIGEAVRDESGVVRRVQGALQDLTERRQAEQKTERLADKLASTLETISDGFFTLDREWRYTYLNREAERVLQKSRDDLIGHVIWDIYPQAVGTSFEAHYRCAMTGQCQSSGEGLYAPWDAWIDVSCYPSDEGISVYFRDVTFKRATQQRLELLEASVSQLQDIVVIMKITDDVPAQRRIVFVNEAFTRASGYSSEEILGRTLSFLDGPRTDMTLVQRLKATLDRLEPVNAELVKYRKDGSWYWSEQQITPIGFAGEGYSHFVMVERDISERKRDQDALRELNADLEARVETRTAELNLARLHAEGANRAKSSFLATMSHEIRTPMNGVIGMIDVLEQTKLRSGQVEIVKTVRESAHALLSIVDDVLDFSKIEAGQFQIDHEPMDVEPVLEGVCDALSHTASAAGVLLLLFIDPAIPAPLLGDATRLRQILMNLVGNAVKFSSGSHRMGCVHVRVDLRDRSAEQAKLEFRVSDNGIGMDRATQERLFTPFTQAEGGATRRFGGTGLGLSISQRLAEMMDATITAESEPKRGSTFGMHITLPIASGIVTRPAAPTDLRGLPCLVIGGPDSPAGDLMTYLAHARASAHRLVTVEGSESWFAEQKAGPCVVVVARTGDAIEQTLAVCRRAAAAVPSLRLRFVVIEHGRHRGRTVAAADVRVLAGEALHRMRFLDGVARVEEPLDTTTAVDPDPLWTTDVMAMSETLDDGQPKGMILVAEDNEINQKVIRRQLALLGFAADIASTGDEALTFLKRAVYDLLLTDLHMPSMDGYELAAKVRQSEGGRSRMPIVALTANAVKGEAKRCLDVGMDDYMTKPLQLANLRAMLSKWISNLPTHEWAAGHEPPPPPKLVDPDTAADLTVLVALVGNDRAVIEEMLQAFRRSAARSSSQILQALVDDDAGAAADAAHMLKSGARSIGAQRLCAVCTSIEEAADRGNAGALPELRERFENEMAELDRFLDGVQADGIDDTLTSLDLRLPSRG